MEPQVAAGFRSDVQGLRAVAVLLVVFDHVLGSPTGGYVGVDVFFVVSGFLITGLLLREHERTGRISLREFYARRVRRLLPAAVLVLAVTNVVAWLVFTGERARQALVDSVWSLGFGANLRFSALGTSYFDQTRPPSPVRHYWSLAVEEQYYLLWPWLLLGLLVLARGRRLLPVVAGLTAAAFAWSLTQTALDPTAAYYSTTARAWELGLGSLLAVALHTRRVAVPRRVGTALGWAGLAGVVAAAVLFDEGTPFPGAAAALPVLATGAVLLGGTSGARNRVLVNPVSAYVGRLSYSLYLWHWPVLVVASALLPAGVAPVALAVSLACAALCHHLVEEPVRRSAWLARPAVLPTRLARVQRRQQARRRSVRTAVALGATAALLTGGWVLPALALQGAAPRTVPAPARADTLAALQADVAASVAPPSWPALEVPLSSISTAGAPEWVVDRCDNVNAGNLARCTYGDPLRLKRAVVVGDSMSSSWLPGLRAALEPRGWKLYVLTRNQCPNPLVPLYRNTPATPFTRCDEHKQFVQEQVRRLKPQLVIMSNAITFLDFQLARPTGAARFPAWRDGLARAVTALSAPGRRVVVIGPPPRSGNLQACVTRLSRPVDCTASVPADWRDLRTAERAAALGSGASYVDVEPWFCAAGRCPAVVGSTPVYTDGRHLTAAYSRRLAPYLAAALSAP